MMMKQQCQRYICIVHVSDDYSGMSAPVCLKKQYSQVITTSIVVNTICHTVHSMTNSNCINNQLTKRTDQLEVNVDWVIVYFTDSTEKQAVEQFETKYDNTIKPPGGSDLAALLMMLSVNQPWSIIIMPILTAITELIKLDSHHIDRTKWICNKHNITVYRTQPNTKIQSIHCNQIRCNEQWWVNQAYWDYYCWVYTRSTYSIATWFIRIST